jgi:hypothetical protein
VALAGEPLRWRHTGLFRGLEALPLRLGPHHADALLPGAGTD